MRRDGVWCASRLREWNDDFDDDRQKWGNWKKGEELAGYVSCSVNPPMGMMTPEKAPLVILALDAKTAAEDGTAFIGKWSSFADVEPETARNQVGVDWFERMFLTELTSHASPHPGEFLVPNHIPISLLNHLVFYSDDDVEFARRCLRESENLGTVPKMKFQVAAYLFGRRYIPEVE